MFVYAVSRTELLAHNYVVLVPNIQERSETVVAVDLDRPVPIDHAAIPDFDGNGVPASRPGLIFNCQQLAYNGLGRGLQIGRLIVIERPLSTPM